VLAFHDGAHVRGQRPAGEGGREFVGHRAFGLGGGGVAALLAMLQTCAPGLVVVNIDNGVGAGATAALIANRVAAARTSA